MNRDLQNMLSDKEYAVECDTHYDNIYVHKTLNECDEFLSTTLSHNHLDIPQSRTPNSSFPLTNIILSSHASLPPGPPQATVIPFLL